MASMSEEDFMRVALAKGAEGVRKGQSPFGACIVKEGAVVSVTHNRVWETTDSTAHAEVNAIREACSKLKSIDLSGCVLYTSCEPCPMCFSATHWAKISKLVYGVRIDDARTLGFNELTIPSTIMKQAGKSPVEIVGNFLKEEAMELFKLWSEKGENRLY